MRTLMALLVVSVLLAAAGCTPAVNLASEETAIRTAEQAWLAAVEAEDVDAWVSFYADDAVVMYAGSPAIKGIDAIRAQVQKEAEEYDYDFTMTTEKIGLSVGGDLAYTYGTYQVEVTSPEAAARSETGKYVTVWKKQGDGSWKIVADIGNVTESSKTQEE